MQLTDSDTTNLRRSAYEAACREFWFNRVMTEVGEAQSVSAPDAISHRNNFANLSAGIVPG
jgi:hypothetical protein